MNNDFETDSYNEFSEGFGLEKESMRYGFGIIT